MAFFYQLQASPVLFAAMCLIFGLMAGSFLNVVIHRLPKIMEREWREGCAELKGEEIAPGPAYNLVVPRSSCPACGHRISTLENIPIVSFLALRGKCSACKSPISVRYPLVEGLSGLLSGFAAWHFGFGLAAAGAMIFCWSLIALTFIDFDTQLLPDGITLPLAWAGLLFNLRDAFAGIGDAVIGAVSGYLFLWCIYWAFKAFTGKEGMGQGDFKLFAAVGAWLGWKMLPLTILLASVVGTVVGIGFMIFAKRGRNLPFAFGPYLAAAALIALFWGDNINRAYLATL